jgi:hypothetical protein
MDRWKSELWKRETKREKGLDFAARPVPVMSVQRFFRAHIAQGNLQKQGALDLLAQLRALGSYVNEEMEKIGSRYGNMTPKITELWRYDAFGSNRKGEVDNREYKEKGSTLRSSIDLDLPLQSELHWIRILRNAMRVEGKEPNIERWGISIANCNHSIPETKDLIRKLMQQTSSPRRPLKEQVVALLIVAPVAAV